MQNPHRSNKLNNREAANKLRHGSPHFKDVLRQRCHDRIKAKRCELFNIRRLGVNEEDAVSRQNSVSNIINEEFNSLMGMMNNFIDIDDGMENNQLNDFHEELINLEQELLQEEDQISMLEYELFDKQMNDFYTTWEGANFIQDFFCPICQKSIMTEEPGVIICSGCQFKLPAKMSINEFYESLMTKTNEHNLNCNSSPNFITVPENDTISLYLLCDVCSKCILIM